MPMSTTFACTHSIYIYVYVYSVPSCHSNERRLDRLNMLEPFPERSVWIVFVSQYAVTVLSVSSSKTVRPTTRILNNSL